MINKKGTLFLIGGSEDKKHDMLILKTIIEKTKTNNIIIIPTASYYTNDVYEIYYNAFKKLNVNNIYFFNIKYEDEVDKIEYINKLNETDLIFFSGGDQIKLFKIFQNSKLLENIKYRFFNDKLNIAGTSAGAAIASNLMIYDGDYQGFVKGTVKESIGFGFLNDIVIDTHFLKRERIPRLIQFLIKNNIVKGIGIDENTCIIINGTKIEVIGKGMVTIIKNYKSITNYYLINDKDIYNVDGIKIGFLSNGDQFDIKKWKII